MLLLMLRLLSRSFLRILIDYLGAPPPDASAVADDDDGFHLWLLLTVAAEVDVDVDSYSKSLFSPIIEFNMKKINKLKFILSVVFF